MPELNEVPENPAELLEIYNFILGMDKNFISNDSNVLFDNSFLAKEKGQAYVNKNMTRTYSDATFGLRNPGLMLSTMKKMTMNIQIYPRIH